MLDINFIRQNPEKVKKACQNKGVKVNIDRLLQLDKQKRELIQQSESLRAEQKRLGKDNLGKAKEIKENFKSLSERLLNVEKEFNQIILKIPNIPLDDVPLGKDESENKVVKQVGKIPKFSFPICDYMAIGKKFDLIDTERAAKASGTRFAYLKNELVFLEFALINFTFDFLVKKGFRPLLPPVMIKPEMAEAMGYLEQADEQEAYFLPKDNLYLIGTSEQSVGAMKAGEVFEEKDLPRRYLAFSTCFRREAGSYGKDTKGILRVHQFDKIEMFSFCKPEDSKKEHQFFLSLEEELMKKLKIPYQVVQMCTADLGRPAAAKYDIETWLPSQNKYRETHSSSNCTDFQARRLNIRYRDKSNKFNFVHTLNGTAFAIGRIIIAILENYQRKDGKVEIPKVLRKYLAFKVIPKK